MTRESHQRLVAVAGSQAPMPLSNRPHNATTARLVLIEIVFGVEPLRAALALDERQVVMTDEVKVQRVLGREEFFGA